MQPAVEMFEWIRADMLMACGRVLLGSPCSTEKNRTGQSLASTLVRAFGHQQVKSVRDFY